MKSSVLVFIFAMLGLVFFVVIVTTSAQWRKIFKGRNYIQILIVVPLTIVAFLFFHQMFYPKAALESEQKFSYGIVDEFLTGIINGMFLALVGLLGFDLVSFSAGPTLLRRRPLKSCSLEHRKYAPRY